MKKQRLQFDFTLDSVQRLDELAVQTSAPSRAAVVRQALSLLRYVAEVRERGGVVLVREGAEEKEIVFLDGF